MKNVLVTGGSGFIGRWLTEELLAHDYRIRIIDSLVEQVHGKHVGGLPENVEFIAADIRSGDDIRRALRGIDGVFHLAAEVGVGQSMYEIERYVSANDFGTAVLLQAIIDNPVQRIVVASSMSVYGEGLYKLPDGSRAGSVHRKQSRIKLGLWDPEDPRGALLTPVPTDCR